MEDTVSRSSLDSSAGEDFVVVNAEPKLRITGDINDIKKEICDGIPTDLKMASNQMSLSQYSGQVDHVIRGSQSATGALNEGDIDIAVPRENASHRGRSTSLPTTPVGDGTMFHGVTYLGCASVNAPRSEVEIYRNMAVLNDQSQMAIPIVLSVPSTSDGVVRSAEDLLVRLSDPATASEIASYRIHRILFCARGPADSKERRCFAFTCSHGETPESAIFQCHVFRCDLPEAVAKILYCFATTFRRVPRTSRLTSSSSVLEAEQDFMFTVTVEFKEDDGKGGFTTCPKDKNVVKFRCNLEKRILISVQQTGTKELKMERCFGLLVSPGRNVKSSDMHLVEMVSMGYIGEGKTYNIAGHWDPTEKCFVVLNTETPKDTRVFMTIAVDLVIHGIQEPVRFAIETKAKIFPQNERFWYFTKKSHVEQFYIRLKQVECSDVDASYEVVTVESQTQIERKKAEMSLTLNSNRQIPEDIQTPQDPDEESDGDEPLLSGSGSVSKDVTDENLLEAWHEVLTKWHQNLKQRPSQVHKLARRGIPEALRGEVWQLLVGCHDSSDLLEAYRVLISKDSPNEPVIQRDINRTFPAHDFFREIGGIGQDSLYKISKAYSVYDEEIGYCQGLSFLAAALLLHMPEEQAFCVLVKIMFDYGLRDLFRQGFEELHLKLYQLERLMQENLSDLHSHFLELNLETHMFASQWFLTLFTAKFPLQMVFRILDIYLSEGKDLIFSVAVALLKMSRKDLLALDFEGVLKYFRVHLPKKYRTEEAAAELLNTATSAKVTAKKLKKYEKEYQSIKEQELQQEDPIERLERENQRLMEASMRLEQENDDLAHEMVESKLSLRSQLDTAQDKCEVLDVDLTHTQQLLSEAEEEKRRLELESSQLKEMCRRELDRAESESVRNTAIISDYKQICSQLSDRLEKQQTAAREELQRIKTSIKPCESCSKIFDEDGKVKLPDPDPDDSTLNPHVVDLERHVRELELELAQTKLALVESECKTQDLTHQLNSAISEIQASRNTWFHKTLNSIKEVANTHTTKKDQKE